MDPVLAQALAGLITAISTAILLWSAHRWGPNAHDNDSRRQELPHDHADHGNYEEDDSET